MTNATLKAAIQDSDNVLKTASPSWFKRRVNQQIVRFKNLLEEQQQVIQDRIKSQKLHNLNAAHDRVWIMEDHLAALDTLLWRGQYSPTIEETTFDAWVD